ncbi:transcription factor TGA2.2 isoform X3 [Arachis hypogaea]|uniref:transcription factor TGA2.2 isoform X3 n=1 Tax=Arachis hypogaea TaxID=3818 RepID=UPI000DEC5F7E|nr:transcription factor TGA9 isoform X3 [Arachis hypogaea]
MASQRIGGDTGLSESLITSHHHASTHGVLHGINTPSSILMNEEGAFDFGELEEAIVLQGIKTRNDEEAKASWRPAATLEMFPSWPIRFHQTSRGGCKSGGGDENTDSGSGSGVNTNTLSSKLETEPHHNHFQSQDSPISSHQQQQDQEVQLATSDASRKGPSPQQKKKGASSTSEKAVDAKVKTLRRLAQNREAARKSRLRKKAYVQQLECSRLKLTQLEKEVERARSQVAGGGGGGGGGGGAMMFDMEYGRWLEDEERQMGEVRRGLEGGISDGEMRVIVESYMSHYDDLFRLKAEGAKWDVFHIMNGTWTSPAERCFLWMGGFRPSDLVGLLIHHLEPLAEQQIIAMYGLRHSSQQAEDALSQGLEQLHHSLLHTISLPQMLAAMAKLSNLEAFLLQADHLRQQTLHQFCRFLTIRQAARCFLVIGDYYARLRALSSLWASRTLINHHDNSTMDLQTLQPSPQNHLSNF